MLKKPPAKTEPKASTIIGMVMVFGRLVRVRFVALGVGLPALLAEEGHQHHARHVERGDRRAQQGAPPPRIQPSVPPLANAASMILSLEKKPDRPGKPMIAR